MKTLWFRYAGIAAIILEYLGVAYFVLIKKHPLGLGYTVSDFGASESPLIFSLVFSIAGILYGCFSAWLYRQLSLGRNFRLSYVLAVIAVVMLSWLPDAGNHITPLLHTYFAVIVMIATPLMIYYYRQKVKNQLYRKVLNVIIWCEVLVLALLPLAVYLDVTLLPEIIASIAFQAWVIMATFRAKN